MKGISFRHLVFLSITVALTVTALAGMIYTTVHDEWKKSLPEKKNGFTKTLEANEGLWVKCAAPVIGKLECETLGISPAEIGINLAAKRAMIVSALFLTVVSIALIAVEFECSKFKFAAHTLAGSMTIVSGILCFAAVSWYALDVLCPQKQSGRNSSLYKFVFGYALYSGFASSAVAVFAGILRLVYACCLKSSTVTIEPGDI